MNRIIMPVCFATRSLVFAAAVLQSFSVSSQCCDYVLNMNDSYGDGWDGALLEVIVNGTTLNSVTAVDFQSTYSFEVCNGDLLELVYVPGDYENEHSYNLFDAAFNLLFSDGPNPQVGGVFSGIGDCNATEAPGHHPCNAIAMNFTECIQANNSGFGSSGFNPGCAAYNGADIWFALTVPESGNFSLATSAGGLNDTGIAVWDGDNCLSPSVVGCDDDGGPDYYSYLLMYDLTPGEIVYVQVFGYGGGQGAFTWCASDLGTVVFENSELPIVMINTLEQDIENDFKIDALMDIKYNGAGNLTYVTDPSNIYSGNIGIEIRGATSAGYPQPSYGFETRMEMGENNNVELLGMPAENDWVLLSNYNDLSLIRNALAFKLFGEMGHYSVRANLCEVMIDSSYKGIYLFGEKIKRDSNRVNIATLDSDDNAGDSITGGYILQQNYWDGNNSFESNYSPLDHPDFDVHFVYEYPKAEVITPQQRTYIASYVDTLEDALYSSEFMDETVGYRNYLSVQSFIDYFLVNELARSNDGFKKSVFFHKDKNSDGGKLKAGPVWDFDWAFKDLGTCDVFSATDGSGWAHLINDCPTDNYSTGWYIRLLQDSTFANQLRCTYENYRTTVLDTTAIFYYIDSVRSLVQNAQARHFQRWPLLGVGTQAPELDPIAATYDEELDKLKAWIARRLAWLDENIPGNCTPIINGVEKPAALGELKYFPNPGNGLVHFDGSIQSSSSLTMSVFDCVGSLVDTIRLPSGKLRFDYELLQTGIFYFSIQNAEGTIQVGKMVVI